MRFCRGSILLLWPPPKKTVDYILEQILSAGDVRARKMFGEYALYCNEKVVALICDDQLFIKITDASRGLVREPVEAAAYPGSKPYFQINPDDWDDGDYLSKLVEVTAASLPVPKPKKKKS